MKGKRRAQCDPMLVERVYKDFKARQAALIKALTTDVEELLKQCDPEKEEDLCLFGNPNEQWEVNLPADEVPPDLPEPVLGINSTRAVMEDKEWLSYVACHSDAWLLSVAFYFGTRFEFDKADRERLFDMINHLPTIYEVLTGAAEKQQTEKSEVFNSNNKSKPKSKKKATESEGTFTKLQQSDEEGLDEKVDEEEQGETFCGACGEMYAQDEFWICCDKCETWFHGHCVKITPAKAEYIKDFKCPPCSKKRTRSS